MVLVCHSPRTYSLAEWLTVMRADVPQSPMVLGSRSCIPCRLLAGTGIGLVAVITREHFIAATGYEPEQDDLERSNCPLAGQIAHSQCGWDYTLNLPEFMAVTVRLRPDLHPLIAKGKRDGKEADKGRS